MFCVGYGWTFIHKGMKGFSLNFAEFDEYAEKKNYLFSISKFNVRMSVVFNNCSAPLGRFKTRE